MKSKLFSAGMILVGAAFGAVLIFVAVAAFMRTSGATGLNVVKIYQLRGHVASEK